MTGSRSKIHPGMGTWPWFLGNPGADAFRLAGGNPRFLALTYWAVLLLLGCGESDGSIPLSGSVTLDGRPLPEGSIELHPIRGTKGPSSGGSIANGKFSISSQKGIRPGTFRVEIKAYRGSGKMEVYEITGEEREIPEQYLPARYNEKSELTVDVSREGDQYVEFQLKSE